MKMVTDQPHAKTVPVNSIDYIDHHEVRIQPRINYSDKCCCCCVVVVLRPW